MSIFEAFLVFAVGWWLVLFMVLPFGAQPPEKPGLGHAASAPANPRLKRKMLITTGISLLLTLLAYTISNAQAASGIYHTGSGAAGDVYRATSKDCVNATASADVAAQDAATMDSGLAAQPFEEVPVYLDTPASDYSTNPRLGDRLYGGGIVNAGSASVNTKTGAVSINGQKVGSAGPADCQ
jgi:predicted secreted protein